MARTAKRLVGPTELGNAAATVYTVPSGTKTLIKNIHVLNPPGGSTRQLTISIGADAAGTRLWRQYDIATGAVFDEWTYFVLEAGEVLQMYADTAATLVATVDGDEIVASGPGVPLVYRKAIAFDTTHISDGTGAIVYTPTVGDVLLDAWIEVDTAWNGTTPNADIGTGVSAGANAGLFNQSSNVINMTIVDQAGTVAGNGGYGGAGVLTGNTGTSGNISLVAGSGFTQIRMGPVKFTATNPLRLWVTQDGNIDGADPGASQGSGYVYLVVSTVIDL